jgi:hypothetical protein
MYNIAHFSLKWYHIESCFLFICALSFLATVLEGRRFTARVRNDMPLPRHINRSWMEVSHRGILVSLLEFNDSLLLSAGSCCVPAAITQ